MIVPSGSTVYLLSTEYMYDGETTMGVFRSVKAAKKAVHRAGHRNVNWSKWAHDSCFARLSEYSNLLIEKLTVDDTSRFI